MPKYSFYEYEWSSTKVSDIWYNKLPKSAFEIFL